MEEVWPLIDEYDQAPCFILVTSQRLRAKPMTTKIAREQLLADIQRLRQELASAEQALRESDGDRNALPEAQLMLSELPGLVMIFDLGQRKIVYINEAVQRVLYLSPETILSLGDRAIVELVHSDDIPRVDSFLHSFENSPHWQTTEFRMRDQAGKWHWLILRGVVIDRDNGQQARRVLVSALEITGRKAAEDALRTSEERHRVLAETMLQGVVHQDVNGFIISMNQAAERILGKSREQFLGSTSEYEEKDTIREDGTVFPGHEHPSMVALRSGETIRGCVMGVWNPSQRMYRWIRIDAVPVFREEGQPPVEVYTVFEDITESKHHLEQLAGFHHKLSESYALLDTLSAKAPIGLAFVDKEFRFQRVNETLAKMHGQPIAAHIGKQVAELFPNEWPSVRDYFVRALAGTAVVNVENASRDQGTETQRYWLNSYYPVTVDDEIIGIGVVAVEVTSQKQIEQTLKDADRHKDEFLATLAHELRNPLAPIRASVEVFKLRELDDPDLVLSRAVIDRQVTHMARLLEDLLDVSRISRNTLELRREQVSLQEVLQVALETSQPIIRANLHQLTVDLPAELIWLNADAVRLAQVFSNLLNNAAKYTESSGAIHLHCEVDGDSALVTVRDNGIGIPAEMQPRIFEIFSQAHPALQRSQGGLGIGLSLVKGLVELHDASIEVFSAGLNQGSSFRVRLPTIAQPQSRAELPETASNAACKTSQCRILVADDMRDNADTLGLMLRVLGHDVTLAYGGEEAFLMAEQVRPHIALLDIGMPKVNGYEAAQRIRSQPWGNDIMLVALTGWAREEDRNRTQAAGFDHHLVKPVALASLVELISGRS